VNLAGATIAVIGRLRAAPRWRIAAELERRGGSLTTRLPKAVGLVVGYGIHARLEAVQKALAEAERRGLWVASERRLLRALDLAEPAVASARPLDRAALAQHSGLDIGAIRMLALFDVLDEEDDRFEFRDLVAARQARRLLAEGASLAGLIGAVLAARGRGPIDHPLAQAQLRLLADGGLARLVGDHLADLDGQIRLPLDDGGNPTVELLYEQAALAEEDARWAEAVVAYRRLVGIAPRDAVAHFNLGNALVAEGGGVAAERSLRRAVALDPGFAEAWYNLAHLLEQRDAVTQARDCLERAVAADERFADAVYNLARLQLAADQPGLAEPLFERYLLLDPSSRWSDRARQALHLCRLLRQAEPGR
jgi:tetratricopeptide (TPR) repeat protein